MLVSENFLCLFQLLIKVLQNNILETQHRSSQTYRHEADVHKNLKVAKSVCQQIKKGERASIINQSNLKGTETKTKLFEL